jgi:transcriptional regulator with XRE-family HTH domain
MQKPTRLAEWCAAQGWTLTDAAGLTGYSLSYLSLVARGKRQLGPAAKVRVAKRLGARVSDLFPVDDDLAGAVK